MARYDWMHSLIIVIQRATETDCANGFLKGELYTMYSQVPNKHTYRIKNI